MHGCQQTVSRRVVWLTFRRPASARLFLLGGLLIVSREQLRPRTGPCKGLSICYMSSIGCRAAVWCCQAFR